MRVLYCSEGFSGHNFRFLQKIAAGGHDVGLERPSTDPTGASSATHACSVLGRHAADGFTRARPRCLE